MMLKISVKMIGVCRRHTSIVHVAEAMPHAVFIIHTHVAHLYGQKIFECGLPYITCIHTIADLEWFCCISAINYFIHSRLSDLCEIELQIMIAEKIPPVFCFGM